MQKMVAMLKKIGGTMTEQSALRFTMDEDQKEKNLCGEKKVMLEILKNAFLNGGNGWVKSVSIPGLGGPWRYTDTIMKLRRLGFGIESRPIKDKNYCEYRLT